MELGLWDVTLIGNLTRFPWVHLERLQRLTLVQIWITRLMCNFTDVRHFPATYSIPNKVPGDLKWGHLLLTS